MHKSTTVVWTLIVGMMVATACGQEAKPPREMRKVAPPPGLPPGPGGFGLPGRVLPLMEALDADQDGQLSQEEIENAVAALKTLDKDKDGKLSQEEIGWPPRGRGMGGPGGFGGGPGGGRGPGGFGGGPGGARGPGGFGGGPGGPGGPGTFDLAERIMSNDMNNDGKVTKEELPEFMQRMLERADTNKDGAIDKDEARAMAEMFGRGGGSGRGGRGGEGEKAPEPPTGSEGDGGAR